MTSGSESQSDILFPAMIGQTIGRYRILEKLGEGGMGAVFKAEDTVLNRPVALKVLSGHLAEHEEARERFLREAQAASGLNHPNITTVYDIIQENGQHLICMEHVEGKTLKELAAEGPLPTEKALDIVLQTADALEAAHARGIYHRDVKSANIMVTPEGRVKVMDFGLAYLAERSQLTRTGTTMGTLTYSSPEQISGRPYDRRSEIFSLGVVCYELLTGQLPFRGATEAEVLYSVLNSDPEKLSSVRPDIPKALEAVVERMLAKDPALRYESCAELTADLTTMIGELGIAPGRLARLSPATLAARRRARLRRIDMRAVWPVVVVLLIGVIFGPSLLRNPFQSIDVVAALPIPPSPSLSVDEVQREALHRNISDRLCIYPRWRPLYWMETRNLDIQQSSITQLAADLPRVDAFVALGLDRTRNGIRLTIKLLDRQGETLWSDEVHQPQLDVQTLPTLAVRRLFESNRIRLTRDQQESLESPPQVSSEAFMAYENGRSNLISDAASLRRSIEWFQRAITLDSTYAQAYADLSYALMLNMQINNLPPSEIWPQMDKLARKALNLDPHLAAAHTSLGLCLLSEYDMNGAAQEYQRAINSDPNYPWAHLWYSHILSAVGRHEEAIREVQTAEILHPTNPLIAVNVAARFFFAGRYEEAIAKCQRVIRDYPTHDEWVEHIIMGRSYRMLKDHEKAISEFEAAGPIGVVELAYTFAIQGERGRAIDYLRQNEDPASIRKFSPAEIAAIYSGLGDHPTALHWLQRAYDERDYILVSIVVNDEKYEPLRDYPAYQDLMDRIGFTALVNAMRER